MLDSQHSAISFSSPVVDEERTGPNHQCLSYLYSSDYDD